MHLFTPEFVEVLEVVLVDGAERGRDGSSEASILRFPVVFPTRVLPDSHRSLLHFFQQFPLFGFLQQFDRHFRLLFRYSVNVRLDKTSAVNSYRVDPAIARNNG